MAADSVSNGIEQSSRSDAIHDLVGYQFGNQIGGGGMADVYEARQVGLDRDVAIKVMKPWLAQDKEFVSRFAREARVCARLLHPHIVQMYDYGSYKGRPCLVMELLEGRTLADALDEHILPLEDTIAIIKPVLEGLSVAHANGIVHRDIKPGNVFLCDDGDVKVMDFGIAHAADATQLTNTGAPLGTPEYMSPEQVEGKKPDARSDIYSVGVLLHKMLTGDVPFCAETPIAILLMHVSKPAPDLPYDVPEWLRRIVAKALSKRPQDRFASAKEMLAAIQERGATSGQQAYPGHQGPSMMPPVTGVNWAPLEPEVPRFTGDYPYSSGAFDYSYNDGRKRTMVIATAAIAVVMLAGIMGFALTQRHLKHNPSPITAGQVNVANPPAGNEAAVPNTDLTNTVGNIAPPAGTLPPPQYSDTHIPPANGYSHPASDSPYGQSPLVSHGPVDNGAPQTGTPQTGVNGSPQTGGQTTDPNAHPVQSADPNALQHTGTGGDPNQQLRTAPTGTEGNGGGAPVNSGTTPSDPTMRTQPQQPPPGWVPTN